MNNGGALENVIESQKNLTRDEVIRKSLELVDSCGAAMIGSNGEDGYPNIKAMLKIETEGIKTIYFSTNTSSKRVAQFKKNPKACVYFVDVNPPKYKGLMLVGEIEVLSDPELKQRFWHEGWEVYYHLGVTDPDYSILRFTTKWANYYESLKNISFEV